MHGCGGRGWYWPLAHQNDIMIVALVSLMSKVIRVHYGFIIPE
jgi:hypothetical protein